MKRPVLLLAMLLAFCGNLRIWAQTEDGQDYSDAVLNSGASSGVLESPDILPDVFVQEDVSPWLSGLRRFEIVSFGAFPIMLFYTNIGYDLSRYIRSGYDSYYAPWPLKSEYSYQASEKEILASLGTAALLSVGVGIMDAILRAIRTRNGRHVPSSRVDSP